MRSKMLLKRAVFVLLLMGVPVAQFGCFPDRVVTEPDYRGHDVRRPTIVYTVPLNGAVDVDPGTKITVWFDELMDETTIPSNFFLWPGVSLDSVQQVAFCPSNANVLYATRVREGIFTSEDGAETWRWLSSHPFDLPVVDLEISRQNTKLFYALTADSGLFRSEDAGVTWQDLSAGLPEREIFSISLDPTDDQVLYVATKHNGVLKSVDGGQTWTEKNTGLRNTRPVRQIAINPANPQVLYGATKGNFVVKSSNGGDSWVRIRKGFYTFNFDQVIVHPQDTSLVFAVSRGGGIYRSHDAGKTWALEVNGLTDLSFVDVVVHPSDTSLVLAATESGLFRSQDGGIHWSQVADYPAEAVPADLDVSSTQPEMVAAATVSGIYLSNDFGQSWAQKITIDLQPLYVGGTFAFETWQDTITVTCPVSATKVDTTQIHPYIYDRALAAWFAHGMKGKPPVDVHPKATKVIFTPTAPLLPGKKYQVRAHPWCFRKG